jgi:tetratricopeptide (TPR) repeat protein
MQYDNWRDCKAWKDENLLMNTTSNQAAKLYDAALTQIVGWYEIDQLDGLNGTLTRMFNEDPNFVLGQCLELGINLLNIPILTKDLRIKFDHLNLLKVNLTLTNRELNHITAINHLAFGNIDIATNKWEEILIENPNDMLAIKFTQDSYFYIGYQHQARESISRVIPFWKPVTPLYSYLYGMWSFGLVQTNYFDQASNAAKKALELNKYDGWATHTINHLNEYKNNYNEGIDFLLKTEQDWTKCNLLSCHNYWQVVYQQLKINL